MDAFDSDALIYAATPGHSLGRRVLQLFPAGPLVRTTPPAGVGSTLLLPEVLAKPLREGRADQVVALAALLGRLDLRPLDEATATLAVSLASAYGLRAADAAHLATAVAAGADRFITNNRTDFPESITEVKVVYSGGLPDPQA